MSIEAMKQALEALEIASDGGGVDFYGYAEDLRQAIAEAEKQEPVAWMNDSTPAGIFARHKKGAENFGCTIPLYTHQQPKREWVGLTDEERKEIHDEWRHKACLKAWGYEEAIEAKLKQKNGY